MKAFCLLPLQDQQLDVGERLKGPAGLLLQDPPPTAGAAQRGQQHYRHVLDWCPISYSSWWWLEGWVADERVWQVEILAQEAAWEEAHLQAYM